MKILSFSYCFPNHDAPQWGIFVYQRIAAMGHRMQVQVCSPQPWLPIIRNKNRFRDAALWKDVVVHRPRFLYCPGILKDSDARLYARGIRNWLKGICRSWEPDLLDAHFIWPDGVGVGILGRELGIPYTITLRGKIYECMKSASQARQCAEALRGAACVISVSSRMADVAIGLGADRNRMHVISNGVDREQFRPRDKSECRSRLGLPDEGRMLVTVAHLGPRKGHHEMIRALARLPEDVRLVIVGGEAQGGTIAGLREVAVSLGVADRLILPGQQPYDKIPLFFCAADASVLASYREGCPNAVLESLACGTPVIATDVGAVQDILPVPEAGRIVPAQRVEPLGDAIEEVLGQKWKPEEVVRRSGVRSWKCVAEEVLEVFESI